MYGNSFRVIPGYEGYAVSSTGLIKSIERGRLLSQHALNGYKTVDAFRGSLTETLPVHRAVALAWVENPNPDVFTVVNHIDGDKTNNRCENLEWTSYSGNNYHAVNNGLRSDNIPCKVRDFTSGEVSHFKSIIQACEFMGLGKSYPVRMLRAKRFGKLIADKFEFKYEFENDPWFYETRKERITPSQYHVIVTDKHGGVEEFFHWRDLLKRYQLYGSDSKSIPALVRFASIQYPELKFECRDAYATAKITVSRNTKLSYRIGIEASNGSETKNFTSLTKCAKHFGVDRSSIKNRLAIDKTLDGWTFTARITGDSNVSLP